MKYKRLFTFGCSFTEFMWPTWADIIAYDTQLPFENWGLCGAGNVGITHRMLEADIKNTFTEDDLLLVMWSSWHREDRIINEQWTQTGNIMTCIDYYDERFIEKYWNEDNDIVKNIGAIALANRSFPITYQSKMAVENAQYSDLYIGRKLYKTFNPALPDIDDFDYHLTWSFDGSLEGIDSHPDISYHLKYVENNVYPNIGLTLKPQTKKYFMDMYNGVIELHKKGIVKKEIKRWDQIEPFFKKHFGFNRSYPKIGFPWDDEINKGK